MTKPERTLILTAAMAALLTIDYACAIDISGSMRTKMQKPGGAGPSDLCSRFDAVQQVVRPIVTEACTFDTDGIEIVPFNGGALPTLQVTNENFDTQWASIKIDGSTNLVPVLQAMIEPALNKLNGGEGKKQVITIYTDGAPGDRKATAELLTKFSSDTRITAAGQIGICIVQIGQQDGVEEWLSKLDTELSGTYDIVSTCMLEDYAKLDYAHQCAYTLAGSFDPNEYEALQHATA